MRGLREKTALVTGAGGAIGSAIARRLAEEGARVAVTDLDAQAAQQTVTRIADSGGEARAWALDISDAAAVESVVEDVEQALGPIEVLINNAGWDKVGNFLDTEPALWQKLVAINFYGPLNMHKAVLARMVDRGSGRVVNIASDAARVGSTGEAVYAGCKGGIVAFSKALAREVARQHICINVLCPGPTDTPLLQSFVGEGEGGRRIYEGLKRAIPFRRLGQPEDIAGAAAFLASEDAGFITGQVLSVSGGLTMAG